MELLKALYDTDSSTKSSVDLPNEFWMEGGSNIPRFYDMGFDGLTEFIKNYQTLLIKEKSGGMENKLGEATEGVSIQYADVKKLATEGTRWGDVQTNNPRVVAAMIDNAFATALASCKTIIRLEGEEDTHQAIKEQKQALNMVQNSATIISAAVDSYGASVSNYNSNVASIFKTAWEVIPASKAIPDWIENNIKSALLDQITDKFQAKSDFNDAKAYKHALQEKYRDILNEIGNSKNIDVMILGMLINSFKPI